MKTAKAFKSRIRINSQKIKSLERKERDLLNSRTKKLLNFDDRKDESLKNLLRHEKQVESMIIEELSQHITDRVSIELDFIRNIQEIFINENKSHKALVNDPDLLSRLKNAYLELDDEKHDIIFNKLSSLSAIAGFKTPHGIHSNYTTL